MSESFENNKSDQPISPERALRDVFKIMWGTYLEDRRETVRMVSSVNQQRLFDQLDIAMVEAYNAPSYKA